MSHPHEQRDNNDDERRRMFPGFHIVSFDLDADTPDTRQPGMIQQGAVEMTLPC